MGTDEVSQVADIVTHFHGGHLAVDNRRCTDLPFQYQHRGVAAPLGSGHLDLERHAASSLVLLPQPEDGAVSQVINVLQRVCPAILVVQSLEHLDIRHLREPRKRTWTCAVRQHGSTPRQQCWQVGHHITVVQHALGVVIVEATRKPVTAMHLAHAGDHLFVVHTHTRRHLTCGCPPPVGELGRRVGVVTVGVVVLEAWTTVVAVHVFGLCRDVPLKTVDHGVVGAVCCGHHVVYQDDACVHYYVLFVLHGCISLALCEPFDFTA